MREDIEERKGLNLLACRSAHEWDVLCVYVHMWTGKYVCLQAMWGNPCRV